MFCTGGNKVKFDKFDWVLLLFVIILSIMLYTFFQSKIDIKFLLLIILLFGLSIGATKKLIDKRKLDQ